MDATHIKLFIDATSEVFQTMLQCAPRCGKVYVSDPNQPHGEVTAIISLSGTTSGTVALAMPSATGQRIGRQMLMADAPVQDAEIADALGEMVNMIAGCAKAKFQGQCLSIGLPTVIHGERYHIEHPRGSLTITAPFESSVGAFEVSVTFAQKGS